MKLELPNNFDNKITLIGLEIAEELRRLIVKIKELGLNDTGYKFTDSDGIELKITEVAIFDTDGKECLSFCLEEVADEEMAFTFDASDFPTNELNSIYSQYYATNISSIKAAE